MIHFFHGVTSRTTACASQHRALFSQIQRLCSKKALATEEGFTSVSDQAIQHLGVDLAVARMICSIGGRVQFVGGDKWFFSYAGLPAELPKQYVGELRIESIDLSGTNVVYEGFELLPQLQNLKYLRLKRCMHVNDHCLSRVGRANELILLDVAECPRLTSKGLATISQLKNLRHLLVHNNPLMEDKELVCLMLEDHLPKLFIDGANYLDALPNDSREKLISLVAGPKQLADNQAPQPDKSDSFSELEEDATVENDQPTKTRQTAL